MTTIYEAIDIIIKNSDVLGTVSCDLDHVYNTVIAEDVYSDINMPPFRKSAMDGYACRSADLEKPLKVIETIPAGTTPKHPVGAGERRIQLDGLEILSDRLGKASCHREFERELE